MVSNCPKCGNNVPEDSVYCPYCGHGIKRSAKTTQVSAGGTLMIVAAVVSFIFFFLSIQALTQIYSWYPPGTAQRWIAYIQAVAIFSFMSLLWGFSAAILSLARRSYRWALASAVLCTLSSAGSWITSMIIPYANLWYSLFYYFLPMFATSLIGTVLVYPRKAEFKQ